MKLFLKPTLLLACVAILFGACSEDDTSASKVLTKADSSEVTSITAGNGKFEVEWVVPEGDPNIVYCVIAWDGPSSGEFVLEADTSDKMTKEINGLSAGNYNVSVQNYGHDVELDSPAVTESIYVYGIETYKNEIPSIKNMFIDGASVTMEWNEAHEDCSGVMIKYDNSSSGETSTSILSIDKPFTITNVMSGGSFTFTSVFQPEEGLDAVMISDVTNASGTFPQYRSSEVPNVPEQVKAYPGNFKIKVDWELTGDIAPERVLITYADGDDISYHFIDEPTLGEGSETFENLPLAAADGGYEVTVRAISSNIASEAVTCSDVEVYDYVSYKLNCSAPSFGQYAYIYNSYQLKIIWEENADCKDITITYPKKSDYIDGNNSEQVTVEFDSIDVDEMWILDDAVPGSLYTCSAKYYPAENSLDVLERTTYGTFPDAEVWKKEQDTDTPLANFTYVWKEYEMSGDAEVENDGYAWSVSKIFDMGYDDEIQYKTMSDGTAPMQTVTIDLGRTYKLSKFAYKAYGESTSSRLSGSNIQVLNLYGTNVKDPKSDSSYNGYYAESYTHQSATVAYRYPVLTNWTCLYYNATMSSDLSVNSNGSFEFDISDMYEPVRYIRIQFVSSFEADRTNDFYIGEIDFWHRGVFDIDNGHDGEYRAYDEWVNYAN